VVFHECMGPHTALDGKTPAESAEIEVKGEIWLTIIQSAKVTTTTGQVGLKWPNIWVTGGAFFLSVGVLAMLVGAFTNSLVGSVAVIGPTIPSVMSILVGAVLIKIGTRPKRFSRRRLEH
jgi:hypothetical protein